MRQVLSVRMKPAERTRLRKAAAARGLTLSDYSRDMILRGLDNEDAIAAIRSEMRAAIERQETIAKQQAESVQNLIEALRGALSAGAG